MADQTALVKTASEVQALFFKSTSGKSMIFYDDSGENPIIWRITQGVYDMVMNDKISKLHFAKAKDPMPKRPEDENNPNYRPVYSATVTSFDETKLIQVERASRGITAMANLKQTAEALGIKYEDALAEFA